ncbi:MAG: M48 family metallopeptidase [Enterobacterales bacterium]|nr:M48 family metallopeptidase [Enterobacterales bacterium]
MESYPAWFSQPYWIYITAATLGVIVLTSLFRSWQINSNPEAIIKMVNATPVSGKAQTRQEKQLVNIVEEMALASGLPIPATYIMKQEQGINAFVSGLTSSNAILVVTQGLLDSLNRSQLQGVIGHEYSHILNGDMRLNLRLMGIIAGILVIGQIGQTLLRSTYHSGRSRSSSKRSGGGGLVAVAIGIFVVGYIGLFFGRIIKAAVSRQREYLADASAIQFTRDREGIAGALLCIRNSSSGSQLDSDKAEEMSHMCFGASTKISHFFSGMLASHPPLEDRIQAVYPGYLRHHKSTAEASTSNKKTHKQGQQQNFSSPLAEGINQFAESFGLEVNLAGSSQSAPSPTTPSSHLDKGHSQVSQAMSENIGQLNPDHLHKAEALLQKLNPKVLQKVRGEENSNDSVLSLIILFALANRLSLLQVEHALGKQALSFSAIQLQDIETIYSDFEKLNFIQRHALFNIALSKLVYFSKQDQQAILKDLKKTASGHQQFKCDGLGQLCGHYETPRTKKAL